MCPWSNEHPSTRSLKLPYVAHKKTIHKDGRPRWIDGDFNRGSRVGDRTRQAFLHCYTNNLSLSWLDKNLLCEILVAILPHRDYVFPG